VSLNLARLRGSLTKNKMALGLLGAAAVAALAWRARSSSSTGAASTGATAASTTFPAGSSATPSYYTAGGSAYDSTASDIYNAIQPQLESVGSAVDKLTELYRSIPVPGTPTTPAEAPIVSDPFPISAPRPSVDPTLQGVYARTGTQALYAAMSDGTRNYLDSAGWDAIGQPKPTYLAADNPLWSRTLTNTDAPLSHRTPA
jgi:hypothetical protein